MTLYALGALVAYKPDWCPPEAVDGWLPHPYQILAIRTYAHCERPVQVHYTLAPATGDMAEWWHMRPLSLVRTDQLRPYPPARCRTCGTGMPPSATARASCADCTLWARHLAPQEATL